MPPKHISERDLGEDLARIADTMRIVAHHPPNWVTPPRNIYGWEEAVPDPDDPDAPTTRRRTFDGWVPVDSEHDGTVRLEDDQRWTFVPDLKLWLVRNYLLVEHQTRIVFTYTVDAPAGMRPMRHLSVQLVVPGRLGQGDLERVKVPLLQQQEPIVLTFFPAAALGVGVRAGMRAGDPWEVVDASMPRNIRAKHWKTPVVFDFGMDHDLGASAQPRPRVRLYGPGGEPV
jgi:hypothetical protein